MCLAKAEHVSSQEASALMKLESSKRALRQRTGALLYYRLLLIICNIRPKMPLNSIPDEVGSNVTDCMRTYRTVRGREGAGWHEVGVAA